MKKDFKYIIKRIIIGVGIILVMTFINSCNVNAMSMSRDNFAGLNENNTGYISSNSYVEGLFYIENTGAFDDYTSSPFFYIDFCTTGNEPSFRVRSNTKGQMLHSNKSYKILSETCDINVNGTIYTNQPIYRQIFTISATGSDECLTTGSLNQTYICRVNSGQGRIYNETDYTTAYRVMKMGLSYTYPIDDLTYLNDIEKMTILNDIKQQLINNNANASIIGKLDSQIQQQQATNNKLDDINDSLTNDSVSDASSTTSSWASTSLSDNVVANMVTMPITLMQAYLNGINSSCQSFSLGTLYEHELILPCINLSSYFGSSLWSVIDILFSGFMIFALGKKFVKIFNDFTNLRDNQVNELYGGGN